MGFLGQVFLIGVAGWTGYHLVTDSLRWRDQNMIGGQSALIVLLVAPVFASYLAGPTRWAMGAAVIGAFGLLVYFGRRIETY